MEGGSEGTEVEGTCVPPMYSMKPSHCMCRRVYFGPSIATQGPDRGRRRGARGPRRTLERRFSTGSLADGGGGESKKTNNSGNINPSNNSPPSSSRSLAGLPCEKCCSYSAIGCNSLGFSCF